MIKEMSWSNSISTKGTLIMLILTKIKCQNNHWVTL